MKIRVSILSLLTGVAASPIVFGAEQKTAPKPVVVASLSAAGSQGASERDVLMAKFYKVTEVKGPPGVDPQVGGLCPMPDGRMAVAFHRGEVAFYNPSKNEWSIFAEGLHEPLGLFTAIPQPEGNALLKVISQRDNGEI